MALQPEDELDHALGEALAGLLDEKSGLALKIRPSIAKLSHNRSNGGLRIDHGLQTKVALLLPEMKAEDVTNLISASRDWGEGLHVIAQPEG